MFKVCMIGCTLAIAFGAAANGQNSRNDKSRLDRDNLMLFRDAGGQVQQVRTQADWRKRRASIVRAMESVMGTFPDQNRRVDLDIQIQERVDAGSYERLLITYQSEQDSRTPAFLCIPKAGRGERKFPAVLCLHPTDNKVGHKVVVGLGGRANRQYAAELAERGYVTIAPAYPHLADYWPNLGKLGYVSGTMKAIWDNSRALDVLENTNLVDVATEHGFGAIGHSLGGHNAIYTPFLTIESRWSPAVADLTRTPTTTMGRSEFGFSAKAGARFDTCPGCPITAADLNRYRSTSLSCLGRCRRDRCT